MEEKDNDQKDDPPLPPAALSLEEKDDDQKDDPPIPPTALSLEEKDNDQKDDHAESEEQNDDNADANNDEELATFHHYALPGMKLHVSFEDLRLTVTSRDKTITILDGVSGNIPAGSSVAIMGESGAGKTSLLNVLCGRAFYGETTGTVRINGEVGDIDSVTSMVGWRVYVCMDLSYVCAHCIAKIPQHDIYINISHNIHSDEICV